jgi:alkanesulfonate monooxygenase SsuD/methylene tetrahydromethanopterin reductase-like flavin-dependent oxidoreductase (luciferase family)
MKAAWRRSPSWTTTSRWSRRALRISRCWRRTFGYVAALTRRMTLGVLVTGVMYRYPGLLAKIVTTLDVLSGGRGRLGVGASW